MCTESFVFSASRRAFRGPRDRRLDGREGHFGPLVRLTSGVTRDTSLQGAPALDSERGVDPFLCLIMETRTQAVSTRDKKIRKRCKIFYSQDTVVAMT